MAHIQSIGAGLYSDLSFARAADPTLPVNAAGWQGMFTTETAVGAPATTDDYTRIVNVRTFLCMVLRRLSRFRVRQMLRPWKSR